MVNVARRILIVEDDLLNRLLLSTVLESSGFQVQAVTDGAHVLEKAEEFVPNLITMDIDLPDISGLELIRRLQADPNLRQIPVLAVTAYVGKGEEARIREAGARGFLAKPISIGPFLAAVNGVLAGSVSRDVSGRPAI